MGRMCYLCPGEVTSVGDTQDSLSVTKVLDNILRKGMKGRRIVICFSVCARERQETE
jgi:hypothetical protein